MIEDAFRKSVPDGHVLVDYLGVAVSVDQNNEYSYFLVGMPEGPPHTRLGLVQIIGHLVHEAMTAAQEE